MAPHPVKEAWVADLDASRKNVWQGIIDFQLYYLTKENTNGRFPQIVLASRGGKRQKREGCHNSSSNVNKIKKIKKNKQIKNER